MIEIICDGGDDKGEKKNSVQTTGIRKPKNIKQIGDVSSGKQIYIEDYAFTYINSIAYNCCLGEQAGVLLGEIQKNEEEKCVFIKGVVKARNTEADGEIVFNENIWKCIYSDVEKYFPNLTVVGWYAIMPQVTDQDMMRLKKIHIDNFSGNMKVMYLVDVSEREENFYLYDKDELKRQKGYVCFYERNCEMQEYMLERKTGKSNEENNNDKVMKSIRNVIHEKEELRQQKRSSSFTFVLTALMLVVVMVTGINLFNNYHKMQKFDQSIQKLSAQMSNDDDIESTESMGDAVVVNKLKGDVYPSTEAKATESESGEKTTESQSEQETQTTAKAQESSMLYTEYTVKQGDTIMSICKNYYGSIEKYEDVLALNQLEDPNILYVGEIIKLP